MIKQIKASDYLYIAIANAFGMDKMVWDQRIGWAKHHESTGALAKMAELADEPLLFTKAVNALRDAKAGVPTGFTLPLDATASGIQILACLMGCMTTAKQVNLVNTGKRSDLYLAISEHMSSMGEATFTRVQVKDPVMTHFYNSTANPKEAFGEDTPELQAFYDALKVTLPGASEAMEDIQACWNPTALCNSWTLPDRHRAVVKVYPKAAKEVSIELDDLNGFVVKQAIDINAADPKGLSLPANVVHSIDGYVVREMYRRAAAQGFDIITIHDSFACSPNHANKLRQNFNDILAEIAESDLLQDILREITGDSSLVLTKVGCGKALAAEIRRAEYALS